MRRRRKCLTTTWRLGWQRTASRNTVAVPLGAAREKHLLRGTRLRTRFVELQGCAAGHMAWMWDSAKSASYRDKYASTPLRDIYSLSTALRGVAVTRLRMILVTGPTRLKTLRLRCPATVKRSGRLLCPSTHPTALHGTRQGQTRAAIESSLSRQDECQGRRAYSTAPDGGAGQRPGRHQP